LNVKGYPINYEYIGNEDNRNDCLAIAINYALRCNYFTNKEQVVRFMKHQLKTSIDDAKKTKVKKGIDMRCFERRFACYKEFSESRN
jgi:hypothetical protein